jgi:transposase
VQIVDACEDIDTLRRRIRTLDRDISGTIDRHEIGSLLTTIDGIGDTTAARLIAEFGDFSRFESGHQVASFVGVVPRVKESGKRRPTRGPVDPIGDAKLRAKLWMPTLTAIKRNPWLRAFYERLIARGKLPKVAITAAMRKLLTAVYSVATHRRPFDR